MKIYQNLFTHMISLESLLNAWDEFKKGKGNKADVQIFEYNLEDNLFRIHQDLKNKTYQHSNYTGFYVRDPKIRHIHKARVRDRIVHHLLFQCLNPIFEPTFIADSYSSRIGKGTHKAVKRLHVFTRKTQQTYGRCFVLKCDINKMFSSIDHQILLNIISKRIKDPGVFWFIQVIIKSFSSGLSKNGILKGIPIGNLTSQFFANVYLNELDQFIKHHLRIKYYIRYTDDFVIIHQDKYYLLNIKEKISDFLKTKLKLTLHPHKVHIRKYAQGIDYLGYVTLPKAQVLRTKMKHRIFKKLKLRIRQFKKSEISEESLIQSFNSYLGVLSHANTYELEQELRHKFWEWLSEP